MNIKVSFFRFAMRVATKLLWRGKVPQGVAVSTKRITVSDGDIEEFIDVRLANMVTMKPGVRQAHGLVPADPKDDMVIAAALEAKAQYLISEDKHLLDLGQYHGIKIMNREQFEAELDRLAE